MSPLLSYAALAAALVSGWAAVLAIADARRYRSPMGWALAWLCLQSALWAGSWVFAFAVGGSESWWLAFRLATTGYGFFGTPAFLAVTLFAGWPLRKAWAWAAPFFLYELVVVLHGWQAPLFALGFESTPWGNSLIHNVHSPWYWADAGLYLPQVVGLVVLGRRAFAAAGPRRQLVQARWLWTGFVTGNLLTLVGSVLVPLFVPGFPSVGVLAGAVAPLFFVVVLRKYRLASPDDPSLLRDILRVVDDPVALLGPDGTLRKTNEAWSQRGGPAPGGSLFDGLEPADRLRERWDQMLDRRMPCPEFLCSQGGKGVFLSLTPVYDEFRDLVAVIAVLRRPGLFDRFAEVHQLSPRETEVALLVFQGTSNRGIAESLGVSEATAKTYLRRLFEKCGATHRLALMREILRPQGPPAGST